MFTNTPVQMHVQVYTVHIESILQYIPFLTIISHAPVYGGIGFWSGGTLSYIPVCTEMLTNVTGFLGGHRDAAMLELSQPLVESGQEPEEGYPSQCPED